MSADERRRFIVVGVRFTEAEYRKLFKERALTPEGTVRNVIRDKLGLRPFPHGWQSAVDPVLVSEREFYEES